MTATTIDAVGFCAHYSTQGDWAFEFALRLARKHGKKLNIFHFLGDPYDPQDSGPVGMTREQFNRYLIERERKHLQSDSLVVVITTSASDELAACLRHINSRGTTTVVITVGSINQNDITRRLASGGIPAYATK